MPQIQGFDLDELFLKFRYPLLILLSGLVLLAGGYFIYKTKTMTETKVEVLGNSTQSVTEGVVTSDISGEVIKPGVYKLPNGSRIDDLLVAAGGLTANADRSWTEKYLNRAAKLTDGQKVYIPSVNEQSATTTAKTNGGNQTTSPSFSVTRTDLVNINTATLGELDTLPGIGQVYGQNIIEHRPYSTIEELVSKGAIKQSLYDKIKDLITIY